MGQGQQGPWCGGQHRPLDGDITCPVDALRQHLKRNHVHPDKFLFTYTSGTGNLAGSRVMLTKSAFLTRLNYTLVTLLRLPPLARHSLRTGGATQMLMPATPSALAEQRKCL